MRFSSRFVAVGVVVMLLTAVGAAQEASGPYRPGNGVTAPTVVKDVKPQYTSQAMEAGIQGTVQLEAVVLEDGAVGDAKVTKSLDDKYGLDDSAVTAIKQWTFKPGTKDGKAVPVIIAIEMSFTLK